MIKWLDLEALICDAEGHGFEYRLRQTENENLLESTQRYKGTILNQGRMQAAKGDVKINLQLGYDFY